MEEKGNEIFLRPRFKLFYDATKESVLSKFIENLNDKDCKYCSKVIGNHVIIDIPKDEDHFWSPQLNVEIIEDNESNKTIVKGLFGPKPQVWTFFMFIHFAVAVAFIIFGVSAYVKWSLNAENNFSLTMCIVLPVLWIVLYFIGRIGKLKGKKQMRDLQLFLLKTLNND